MFSKNKKNIADLWIETEEKENIGFLKSKRELVEFLNQKMVQKIADFVNR